MEKEIDEVVEEPAEEDNVEAEDFDEEELTPIIIPEIIEEEEEVIPVIPPRPEVEEVIEVELPMVTPPPKEVEEETEVIEE